MSGYTIEDLVNILPIVFVVVWALALLMVEAFTKRRGLTLVLAAVGLLAALFLTVSQFGVETTAFKNMLTVDGYSLFMYVLVLGSGLFSIALAYDYNKRMGWERGEYYVLMLFSIAGAMLMASAANLIVVFLALELLSIPLYILAAFVPNDAASEEAGLKYFLLGAFAGGFVLYGVALIYGATGATDLMAIVSAASTTESPLLLLIGAALILIGLGFKVAVVPFHMWTPDVYQGAPTPVTAYMAVVAKAGGFAALLRVFIAAFPSVSQDLVPVLSALVILTLVIGNLAALAQKNIKRMFAYSSISHAGFIMMAFVTYGQADLYADAVTSVLFYLLAFAVTSFGSWAVVVALEQAEGKGLNLEDYAGLGKKHPALALSMLVFLLSFAGVPPTLGFGGKFFLFRTVLEGGYVGLAIVGVLASLVSAYYYLRVVIYMYFHDGDPEVRSEPVLNFVTAVTAVGTLFLFFMSGPILKWAAESILALI
ncbi:MAG TPA: NADH-quinone oxidoreductase subunit N [Anaerolineales bacterium]|jgi:NADH-quinone oxidoreductase subunit N|nr:NADH-quinone oxidoreductase subunit N [Anaerolineales bacterium]